MMRKITRRRLLCGSAVAALLAVSQPVSARFHGDGSVSSGPPPACACGTGSAPNICASNTTPTAGATITATLVCGPSTGVYIGFTNSPYSVTDFINTVNTVGGASTGTFSLVVPNVASDRAQPWAMHLYDRAGTWLHNGSDVLTVPPNRAQVLGNTLPASAGGDPFTPAHTMTVCPSGCSFAHPQDAIDTAHANNWDNVLVTVEAADYPFDDTGAVVIGNSKNQISTAFGGAPAHLWVKGIIGGSGTDGTVFPHLHGTRNSGGYLLQLAENVGQITVDNMEFGPYGGWAMLLNGAKVTLRNVYVHDTNQGLITSDAPFVNTNNVHIFNSHFARAGGGNGPEHNIYMAEAQTFWFINSISEQPYIGHAIKSRAFENVITCSKVIINADSAYFGSQVVDIPGGGNLTLTNNVFLSGNGADPTWQFDQSFDTLRYRAEIDPPPWVISTISAHGNKWVVDDTSGLHEFIELFSRLAPSPPYQIRGDTFVYYNSAQSSYINGGNQQINHDGSDDPAAIVRGFVGTMRQGDAFDIDLGTLGVDNFMFLGRAAAGLPPQSYPLLWSDSQVPANSTACTDTIGMVKVPAN